MQEDLIIKLINTSDNPLPNYATAGATGADIRAFLAEQEVLKPGERKLIPTGLFAEIPPGYEIQVRPRSGLAVKHGITCLNTPGTIDSDYRGEFKILLINLGKENVVINSGDRIAQLVIQPVIRGNFIETSNINKTERSVGGFGHTGIQ